MSGLPAHRVQSLVDRINATKGEGILLLCDTDEAFKNTYVLNAILRCPDAYRLRVRDDGAVFFDDIKGEAA